MTSRERVKAAIRHEQADRCPYLITMCGDAAEQLAPHTGGKSFAEFIDNDVIMVFPPWWQWHELGEDWIGMDVPTSPQKVRGTGSYGEFFDNLKELAETTDKYLLVGIYGSHFEKAYFSRGLENFMADMAGASQFAHDLMRRIVDRNLVMLENILTADEIDGVLLGSDWGTQRGLLMSPEVWDDMIRPGEQREYDLIHTFGKDVWVHSCGKIDPLIPRLVEMGLDVLNPVQPECMDLETLKRDFGDKLAFYGGITTQTVLPFGTPDEVRTEARRVRDLMGAGGGYIFSPSQDLQADVPAENVLALLDVARETQ